MIKKILSKKFFEIHRKPEGDGAKETYLDKIRRLLALGRRQTPEEYFAQWI